MGRHSEDRREAGLVPEISLAARAGSLGATSLQTPYRFQGSSQDIAHELKQDAFSRLSPGKGISPFNGSKDLQAFSHSSHYIQASVFVYHYPSEAPLLNARQVRAQR